MGKHKQTSGAPVKRPRASSSEDDPEVLLDTFLGALSNPDMLDRFVNSLCSIPLLKDKIVQCLMPSLEDQITNILQPLKETANDLKSSLKTMQTNYDKLEDRYDDLEQYSRRQSVRIAGVGEIDNENTDDLVVSFAKDVLDIDLEHVEIDRSHRVGKASQKKPVRDIIVRFVSYKSRRKVLKAKRNMFTYNQQNNTRYQINEDLTKKRSFLAFQARQLKRKGHIDDTWTFDGKIFIKLPDSRVQVCTKISDLPNAGST